MGNIWEFLYQTLTVSAVAAVLLLVKWLLRDKLSPRWQYGVWAVLALRAVIPAGTARSVAPALAPLAGDGQGHGGAWPGFDLLRCL